MKSILFVCSANKDRSKTAEDYFSISYPEFNFESAGTNKNTCNQLGTNYISKTQLDLADSIYVMETKHANAIKQLFGNTYYQKIRVLHVKDMYKYGSEELIEVLNKKIPNF